jgi:Tfp pilus assembly protein PilZ
MSVSERRTARRFVMNVPLQLQRVKTPSPVARTVNAMNISTRGVYFATDLPLRQGELVQVRLQIPHEISGNVANERRFTGRVAHVHPNGFANGMSGVGVQFLHYEEIALQLQEQEQEISEARSIQKGFLPKEIPELPGYEIASAWRSARVVGGDYFDVLPFDANELGLCIADVAGKGFSAALLMSNLQAAVRGLAAPSLAPNELCVRLNSLLHRNMEGDRFVTFFYAQSGQPRPTAKLRKRRPQSADCCASRWIASPPKGRRRRPRRLQRSNVHVRHHSVATWRSPGSFHRRRN